MESKIKTLEEKIDKAQLGGGEHRIAKQNEKKKLNARERVNYLLDEGSFVEIGILKLLSVISCASDTVRNSAATGSASTSEIATSNVLMFMRFIPFPVS